MRINKKQQRILLSLMLAGVWLVVSLIGGEDLENGGGESEEQGVPAEIGTHASIVRIVDGDTVKIREEGAEKEETVRVVGINTPETVDPRKSVECFGKEASRAMEEMLTVGEEVVLTADATQDDRDKYGRLLRYIADDTGQDVGLRLIAEGYAQEYTYKVPYTRQELYRNAEEDAEHARRGLWGDVCTSAQ